MITGLSSLIANQPSPNRLPHHHTSDKLRLLHSLIKHIPIRSNTIYGHRDGCKPRTVTYKYDDSHLPRLHHVVRFLNLLCQVFFLKKINLYTGITCVPNCVPSRYNSLLLPCFFSILLLLFTTIIMAPLAKSLLSPLTPGMPTTTICALAYLF